jgi:hypothetical protein
VLVPNESGATIGLVVSLWIERLPYPKRTGLKDFGLIDLPYPARLMSIVPLGTLTKREEPEGSIQFAVRRGVDVFPTVGDPVLLPTQQQLRAVVEGESAETAQRVQIGRSPVAGHTPVFVDPNKLFGRHVAVLGNTGSGKSCSVAGLIRWSLARASDVRKDTGRTGSPNARFIVLDPNGEYAKAFADMPARLFRVGASLAPERPLTVPAWLWNGDEWSAFTSAQAGVQRPVLLEALRRLKGGDSLREPVERRVAGIVGAYLARLRTGLATGEYLAPFPKFDTIISLLTALAGQLDPYAGDPQLREEVRDELAEVARLLNDTEVAALKYVDAKGQKHHRELTEAELRKVVDRLHALGAMVGVAHDVRLAEDAPEPFDVDRLPEFVEALAATGAAGRDLAQFVDTLNLRIRGLFARERLSSVANPKEPTTLKQWLEDYVGEDEAKNGTVTVLDLSLVPSDVVHVIVAVLSRMVFEAIQRYRRKNGNELPTVLVVEEAHSFVHRDYLDEHAAPASRLCARTLERIAREGRKFGLGLVISSQRPSELSATVLSQCNTFLLHRIVNDHDQGLVKRFVPDELGGLLRELPSLPAQRAILLGWAAPAPVLVEMEYLPPEYRPHSPDPGFWEVWTGDPKQGIRRIDWAAIATDWARRSKAAAKATGKSSGAVGSTGDAPGEKPPAAKPASLRKGTKK